MAKHITDARGTNFEFPDDATPDEINSMLREHADSDSAAVQDKLTAPQEGSALSRFGKGAWDTTIGGLGSLLTTNPLDTLKGMAQGHVDQGSQAVDHLGKFFSGDGVMEGVSAMGHGLAAALPLVGPAAAHAGEEIGRGNVAGGMGEAAGMILGGKALEHAPIRGATRLAGEGISKVGRGAEAIGTKATSSPWTMPAIASMIGGLTHNLPLGLATEAAPYAAKYGGRLAQRVGSALEGLGAKPQIPGLGEFADTQSTRSGTGFQPFGDRTAAPAAPEPVPSTPAPRTRVSSQVGPTAPWEEAPGRYKSISRPPDGWPEAPAPPAAVAPPSPAAGPQAPSWGGWQPTRTGPVPEAPVAPPGSPRLAPTPMPAMNDALTSALEGLRGTDTVNMPPRGGFADVPREIPQGTNAFERSPAPSTPVPPAAAPEVLPTPVDVPPPPGAMHGPMSFDDSLPQVPEFDFEGGNLAHPEIPGLTVGGDLPAPTGGPNAARLSQVSFEDSLPQVPEFSFEAGNTAHPDIPGLSIGGDLPQPTGGPTAARLMEALKGIETPEPIATSAVPETIATPELESVMPANQPEPLQFGNNGEPLEQLGPAAPDRWAEGSEGVMPKDFSDSVEALANEERQSGFENRPAKWTSKITNRYKDMLSGLRARDAEMGVQKGSWDLKPPKPVAQDVASVPRDVPKPAPTPITDPMEQLRAAAEAIEAPRPDAALAKSSSDWTQEMADLRDVKPRPIRKLYGSTGPTPAQQTQWNIDMRRWNQKYRNATKNQKAQLVIDNENFRKNQKAGVEF